MQIYHKISVGSLIDRENLEDIEVDGRMLDCRIHSSDAEQGRTPNSC
jgi:hypothetical protein